MSRFTFMPRFALLFVLLYSGISHAELDISDAWIKNLPDSVPMRAGYMTIHNHQTQAFSIVGAHSDLFAAVEIHQTQEMDGMMHMEPVPELPIAAGATLQLAPGGIHLMLMHPQSSIRLDDRIRVTLKFADGSEQQFELTVRK